jgi:predicted RNA binding protein YcfA (HicA-like mRNA interferase family)
MARRQKRAQILFRKPPPADMSFETIQHILKDCGFVLNNVNGEHFIYAREDNPEVQKTVPTIKGRKVGKRYFERIQENVMRFCPELLGGQR